ncbi:MAG: FAD-dependent oxidoreductase, partial [Actinomycetota bacterium]
MPPPVVVVGASVAGVSAVDELREAGFDGEVVLVGAEPQLPYDRPPLSKELLQGARSPAELWLRPPSWYEDHGVTLELGVRAVALDPAAAEIALDDGRALRYRAALVATGASPREIPGLAGIEGVHLLRTLDDATRLAEVLERGGRVTVVGGGFIGLEVAASARARGCAVTVLEARESVLADAVGPAVG